MTNKYHDSKIYKIISDQTDNIYIGSTTQSLSNRMAGHRKQMVLYKNNQKNYCGSFEILQYADARIVLIEKVKCESKEELRKLEEECRQKNKDICTNKYKAFTGLTPKEYWAERAQTEEFKAKQAEYREKNRELINERHKKYRDENKELVKARKKKYYDNNIELMQQKSKKYREEHHDELIERKKAYYGANKEAILQKQKEKATCECGSTYRSGGKARHLKTTKHQEFIAKKN